MKTMATSLKGSVMWIYYTVVWIYYTVVWIYYTINYSVIGLLL